MTKHKEKPFEDAIEHVLLTEGGYERGRGGDYDKGRGLEPQTVLDFIRRTQPKLWDWLSGLHGADADKVLLDSLVKELDTRGMLSVLRHGFKCYGRRFQMAYFMPNNALNPETGRLYGENRVSVTRQLYYSEKNTKSLDLVLFVNGLPVVTAELKSPLSGQTVDHAKAQYKNDRDPNEKIFEFKRRALVHFAVDADLVFMTTRLSGNKTVFLPFNLGAPVGSEVGAGNPSAEGDYKTAYLWREVWQRDSLLDIVGRFMHLQSEEKRIFTDTGTKKITKEVMIFPRYHQLGAVRKLVAHSRAHGSGHNYLVEHSAGSGKSNSIAWLAHRLSSLHTDSDEKVFHSVVVVTDRRVLDQQLQDTIYQFEHKQGVVKKIDEDTRQLAQALSEGTPVIITTLQKFPFVAGALERLNVHGGNDKLSIKTENKHYAVIVDEAHSSQSGESAAEIKHVLNKDGIEKKVEEHKAVSGADEPDGVLREMLKRGRQPNLSFYAFTATPKYKTKHVFNELGPTGAAPFHKYSMRQAIEEGFILDVLANYTTYKLYYRLTQAAGEDPKVMRKQAAKALARFVSSHDHNISQKTEVIIEHFRAHVRHKIGGRAKAMVVTESRWHAVRYKLAFDAYVSDKGYTDVRSLVAFSGTVQDPELSDKTYTEVGMNGGIREKELPEVFDTGDYRLLIVADKYQTGFDQPLLHTMYVDKKLSGVQAVQTLSRLNRTATGKDGTFVLDFRNEREEIFDAFKPYYGETIAEPLTDAQHLYRLQGQIEAAHVVFEQDVQEFCEVFFADKRKESVRDQARMNAVLDRGVARYKELPEEDQGEFKSLLVSFRNLYAFLSQVIPYGDSELEQLYTYLRFLITKLPSDPNRSDHRVDDDVALEFYRLQKISEGRINLNEGSADPLKGPSDVGTGQSQDEITQLSELVKKLNERFGTDFTEADQLFFDQIEAEALDNDQLKQAAKANSEKDFGYVFRKAFEGLVIDRMEGNEEIFGKIMKDGDFRDMASEHLLRKVYQALKEEKGKVKG